MVSKKETFHIIGIEMKTSNQKAMNDIPQLWDKFFSEDVKNKIPNKLSEDIFAVYTEYEGDYTKPYTYILGCTVSSLVFIPNEMIGITIPTLQYEVLTVKGKMPEKVIEAWQYIWQPEVNAKRAYKTDFEVYGEKYGDLENSEVEICVSLK
jgi:predicted transcriptional regulator YdeE